MLKTIPGKPAPEPKSVHIFISFLSINSMVCALSIICLCFIDFSVVLLIKFMSLFFLTIVLNSHQDHLMFHVKHLNLKSYQFYKYAINQVCLIDFLLR